MRSRSQIVYGHLKKISGEIFTEYPEEIRNLIKGKAGVYALYRRDKLYYIGLASNLMGRIKNHSNDRHKGLWDKFSIILTSPDHIKELEALLLIITDPQGNKVGSKFTGSTDLNNELIENIKQKNSRKTERMMGKTVNEPRARKKTKIRNTTKGALKGLVSSRMKLKGQYKGSKHTASLRKDATVRYKGKVYPSPTAAAKAATGRKSINGLSFWRYQDKSGEWVKLRNIKQTRTRRKNIGRSGTKRKENLRGGKKEALEGLVSSRMKLKGQYKDNIYTVSLRKNGTIQYKGHIYYSPTAAANAATGQDGGINGWSFWRYKDKSGQWVKLSTLKK